MTNGHGGIRPSSLSHPTHNFPPPYRSPPNPLPPQPTSKTAYSKFNVSEPNINGPPSGIFTGSPVGYRHTMTLDHSHQVQHGLKNMLSSSGAPLKHSTLDSSGQSYALQQLRSNGLGSDPQQQRLQTLQNRLPLPGDTYVSPDNLRDTANRMFSRNQQERSSFGGNPMMTQAPSGQPKVTSGNQENHYYNTQRFISNPNQSDDGKRHSFTNQSFRKATGQDKTPPQVPPKPHSRSTSKERLRDPNDEADHLDAELKHILRGSNNNGQGGKRISMGGTPPLPALSPDPTPESSPDGNQQKTTKNGTKETSNPSNKGPPPTTKASHNFKTGSKLFNGPSQINTTRAGAAQNHDDAFSSFTQSTMGALTLDLESVLGLQTDMTSDDSTTIDNTDAAAIRKQLDGLESMYSEVLKLLGLRKYGRAPGMPSGIGGGTLGDRGRRKLYGSMSSLPSVSSIGSRHVYKDRRPGERAKRPTAGGAGKDKSVNKRFQRLESHVVTLARSVAHLTSEMRNQQLLIQEVEALRLEMQQLRGGHPPPTTARPNGYVGGYMDPESFFASQGGANKLNTVQANRVRKLTKFFGAEPPLLRLFLKNLGYEKYASAFEDAKIGLLELPYLSEERLEQLGLPMGPRMRIMQEAKVSIGNDQNNVSVYIL